MVASEQYKNKQLKIIYENYSSKDYAPIFFCYLVRFHAKMSDIRFLHFQLSQVLR